MSSIPIDRFVNGPYSERTLTGGLRTVITDKTLDEAMAEALRFLKAAKALRATRKALLSEGEAAN